jgi:hypothetical protein
MKDFEREYKTEKWCAPTCTLQCVHQVGILDNWRHPQQPPGETLGTSGSKDSVGQMVRAD